MIKRITGSLRSIYRQFKEVCIFLFITFFGGIVIGLGIWLGIMFAFYHYLWVLGATCFFSLFHLGDLRGFLRNRNLTALFGRLLVLFGLSAFISGYFAYASGLAYIRHTAFTNYAALVAFAFGFGGVGIAYLTRVFFRYTVVSRFFKRIMTELSKRKIIWF